MIDYRQLQALAAVADLKSFEKAAGRLCITQSAVSQRIKQLEERIGQLLLVREQPFHPTTTGQKLLRHFRQVSMLQDELQRLLDERQESGFVKLAIGINADSLATWFMEAVDPLLHSNKLLFELQVDDQAQTHHLLRQGEVVGCISSSNQPVQGANCTLLGGMRYRAMATPDFIEQYFAQGIDLESLMQAPAVEFNQKDELQDRYLSQYFNLSGNYPKHSVPSSQAFFELIERGHAWGMVPDQQGQTPLDQGSLCELSPGHNLVVPLYWHTWSLSSDISRRLTDCLVHYCQHQLLTLSDQT